MVRESKKARVARALQIEQRMDGRYGDVACFLDYGGDPFRLAVAVMLSAQTTDKKVNQVTPLLWERYPSLDELANAKVSDVENILHPLGFYHSKALRCIDMARMVLAEFDGKLPRTMEQLQQLPGVGRKTANIVMNVGFGIVEGIAVDTHVFRISHQLGLSTAATPAETEKDLMALYPHELWGRINHQWIRFGREICIARHPHCEECFLADLCPQIKAKG